MNQKLAVLMIASSILWVIPAAGSTSDAPTEQNTGDQIVAKIKKRIKKVVAEYPGSYSRREVTTRIYDPDDGELESSKDFVAEVWEFQDKKPRTKFLSCTIDGKKVDPEDCREEQQSEPPHDAFGPDGEKHYKLEYHGTADWKGRETYKIKLVPREDTPRHAKGDLYFATDTLNVAGMSITIADYPFGLENLAIEMSFEDREERAILSNGETKIEIYVPLLIHERRVTKFTASDQKLLTKEDWPPAAANDRPSDS